MKHIHLIGIGGTGLSAIAHVLLEQGYHVSGSDRVASPMFNAATSAGAETFLGHAPEHVIGADLVVRSSAIPDDNPEVVAALNAGISVIKRSDFLPNITQGKYTIAIAGSHGKTTTTAMISWILQKIGEDPSFIVGSVISQLGCNAHAGEGKYFVIEADEYDYMFLGLNPTIAVVTNIEHDHPDCFPTEKDYQNAFIAFLNRLEPSGVALICGDDNNARSVMEELQTTRLNIRPYGISPNTYYYAKIVTEMGPSPSFEFCYRKSIDSLISLGVVDLKIPGRHNVLNATGALGVIHQLGLPMDRAIAALGDFTGADRRFEIVGQAKDITIIDDYGHHPTEIASTLQAAKEAYPDSRIWAIWQPHTFTRTKTLEAGFIKALSIANCVMVLKIYGAREEETLYSAECIAKALPKGTAVYKETFEEATYELVQRLSPGDVAIFFSAGDATQVSQAVLSKLKNPSSQNIKMAGDL